MPWRSVAVELGQPEHAPAENKTRRFDLLGQPDFLFASEQRNRAHLREVHADGVIDALG